MSEQTKEIYKKFGLETELISKVTDFLIQHDYKVRLEVPNSGQSADLVAEKMDCILIVEAKLKNWRRALVQCKTHENIADRVCIAWGAKGVPDKLLGEVKKLGYGIIHCSGQAGICEWKVKPQRNMKVWHAQRNHWEKFLKEVPIEC